ncbi:MAG: SUMF1/EgtB/PvdO family nonheme iron enzyme [Caldilineaceae bacterium]
MSFFRRRSPSKQTGGTSANPYNARADQRNPTLDWEFGADDVGGLFDSTRNVTVANASRGARVLTAPAVAVPVLRAPPSFRSVTPLAEAFQGEKADAQVAGVRKALNKALEAWWSNAELPPTELLRDGLLVLEAGHVLGESQRSLLLRTALMRGKGILTALRHQTDSERTATLLKEALLDLNTQFLPVTLAMARTQDERSEEWAPFLIAELTHALPTTIGRQRQLAVAGLAELQDKNLFATLLADWTAPPDKDLLPLAAPVGPWSRFRVVLLVLLTLALVVAYLWYHVNLPAMESVRVPAGTYTLHDSAEVTRTVTLTTFRIDQTEVTNAEYGRCFQQGYCQTPGRMASATRPTYFTDPAFAAFPMVNIDWDAARRFCKWKGERLPTIDEWQVAASFAPITKRLYRFPWGDAFDPLLANNQATATQDTQMVGFYHPAGDSPLGLRDMAGNVAEWTATVAPDGEDSYVVKGGSFRDDPATLQTTAQQSAPRDLVAPWLGFRCASSR